MAFHFSDLLVLVRSHPFVSCFLLLFFTPPLFPVVVYFSPLIVSTALCVLALVSISAHFSASSGESGASDGAETDLTDEKTVKKVRVSKHESPWMEWIKGCDETMRHFVEKQPAEDHELRRLSVKEEWSNTRETNNADGRELANHPLGEEESRTVAPSVKQDLYTKEEGTCEEEHHTGSGLRFSFFQNEDNTFAVRCSGDSDPSTDGCSTTANLSEKNPAMNAPAVAEIFTKPCYLQNAGPATEDGKVLAPAMKVEQAGPESPEE